MCKKGWRYPALKVTHMLNGFNLNFQFLLKQGIARKKPPKSLVSTNNKAIISRTKLTKLKEIDVQGTPIYVLFITSVIETTR